MAASRDGLSTFFPERDGDYRKADTRSNQIYDEDNTPQLRTWKTRTEAQLSTKGVLYAVEDGLLSKVKWLVHPRFKSDIDALGKDVGAVDLAYSQYVIDWRKDNTSGYDFLVSLPGVLTPRVHDACDTTFKLT